MILDIFKKYKFDKYSDRLGLDCPFTHWKLYFKKSMRKICQKKFASFGENAEFRPGAYAFCCSNIHIGCNVVIRPMSCIFANDSSKNGKIVIEDNCLVGSGVHIYTSNHRFDDTSLDIFEQGYSEPKDVILKKGCWIGASVIILPGVVIGKNSVVGAGSVVTKSVPDFCVVAGNPAKIIKNIKDINA